MNTSNVLSKCHVVLAVMVAAWCLAAAAPAHANLVVDPGFESEPSGTLSPPWFSPLVGPGVIACSATCVPMPHAPHSGLQAAQFYGWDYPGLLLQEIATSPGQLYEFSFWLSGDGYSENVFRAFWGGNMVLQQSVPGTDWVLHSFIVSAGSTSTVIQFFGTSHLQLDDVSVIPVSEPTPLSLLGLALAGLGFSRRPPRAGRGSTPYPA